MHNEIKLSITAAKKGYFALGKLFKSKLLSIKSKSPLKLSYDQFRSMDAKLLTFERKILRLVYAPIIENGKYRRRTNREV